MRRRILCTTKLELSTTNYLSLCVPMRSSCVCMRHHDRAIAIEEMAVTPHVHCGIVYAL